MNQDNINNLSDKQENASKFQELINTLYLKAQNEIQIKKEKDRIFNEKLDTLKDVVSKLNYLLQELNIDDGLNQKIEFILSDTKTDINENFKKIIGDKLTYEIENIFIEIIQESEKQYDLNKYIMLKSNLPEQNISKSSKLNYKQIFEKKDDNVNNIKKYILSDENTSKNNPENGFHKIIKKKKEKYYVEFAVFENELKNIDDNIKDVIDEIVDVIKLRNGKFIPNGKRKLRKPINVVIDDDQIKEYAKENQISGRLVFEDEEEAKTWRCLTFDVNYGKRPIGIYIVKNQLIF